MKVRELVDKYFGEIEVESAEFIPYDEAKSDVAYLLLNIPVAMFKEYLILKGQTKGKFPEGAEFWRETGLGKRLRNSNKDHGQGVSPLLDILDFLEGDVQIDYQDLFSSEKIRFEIMEIPELYIDEDF